MSLPAPVQVRLRFERRRFLAGLFLFGLFPTAGAQAGLAEAIGVLSREKSVAETYARILAVNSRMEHVHFIRGVRQYVEGKAEFDGLVAELEAELGADGDPSESPKFAQAVQAAAEKRVGFTNYIEVEVIGKLGGTKPELPDMPQTLPELVDAIMQAGSSIRSAYHDADETRRKAILRELEQLQWRPFAEIAQ
jgi:hypothetical protein